MGGYKIEVCQNMAKLFSLFFFLETSEHRSKSFQISILLQFLLKLEIFKVIDGFKLRSNDY